MCYYWDYSTGHTTDPKFVASLIEVLRDQISPKIKIHIVESDASAMKCKYSFKMLGYEKLARQYKVSLVNLSEEKREKVAVMVDEHLLDLRVPQIINNADLKINVPKIKYSWREIKVTCALKNVFGCIPNANKFAYHPKIGEAIVGANKVMRFHLCILDGNNVLGAQTRKLKLVMTSKDPVAFDSVAALIAGVNPKSVNYLQLASREGIGKTVFVPKGVPVEYFRARYPKKSACARLISKFASEAFDIALRLQLDTRLGLD